MAGMDGARRRTTYEDVLAAPDHLVAEILDGELYTTCGQPRQLQLGVTVNF